ncbi:unnamed protein product [Rhizophagus irregularis]|uniref:MULE transposase domain-containing protein n=1 Tax=Rhizophagus irregularis TaxID=588596 RepID=A0A2N1M2Q3_9GLOM|nr:hypothetical protein RhiirC2_801166 [Rhizophagus irregularis]CAB4387981.1 unnamed protein product [Rhizophagus irregularis]
MKSIEQQHNKGSKKTDCKWHVNLSKPKNTNFVHITFIHPDHNHELLVDNAIFAAAFRRFDISIMKEIEYAITIMVNAQAFLNDETQESYEWVLQQTLDATGSKPRVISIWILQ